VKRKKMKKTKIIAILIALGIVTAMTGIATADPDQMNIYDDGTTTKVTSPVMIGFGSSVDLDMAISAFSLPANSIHSMTVELYDPLGNQATGIQVYIAERDNDGPMPTGTWNTPADNPVIQWKQNLDGSSSTNNELFDIRLTETRGVAQTYTIVIKDVETGKETILKSNASFDISVPEFATIAIPTVTILGLFLFFNHRKHKKE
jgi:hypothetical protein